MTNTITITLPETITVPVGKTGLSTKLNIKDLNESVIAMAVINGFTSAINDVSRGKDDSDKPNSDDVWAAMRDKRCAAWLAGTWTHSKQGAGASIIGRMKEAYVSEQSIAHNVSATVIRKKIKQTVADVFGADEPATFNRFLDAIATLYAKANKLDFDDVRYKLEAKYTKLAIEAAAQSEQLSDSLDLSAIEL